jgi:hypothetical protein
MKEWAWRCFEVVIWTLTALMIAGTFVAWVMGVDDGKPREGQQCGPAHHWAARTSRAIGARKTRREGRVDRKYYIQLNAGT